ncbi:hypothetical protein [Helicobacter bilis]|nr:hypothetical protein [Helicobacter bilis]
MNNYNDIVMTSIPVAGWGAKGAQKAMSKAGWLKTASKEAAKVGAISFAASPLDYAAQRNYIEMDIDPAQMLNYATGNAIGAAAGTMAAAGLIKGVSIELNNINKIKRKVCKLEKSMKNKDLNIAK